MQDELSTFHSSFAAKLLPHHIVYTRLIRSLYSLCLVSLPPGKCHSLFEGVISSRRDPLVPYLIFYCTSPFLWLTSLSLHFSPGIYTFLNFFPDLLATVKTLNLHLTTTANIEPIHINMKEGPWQLVTGRMWRWTAPELRDGRHYSQ